MPGYDCAVHRPPPFYLYYDAWLFLGVGVTCLALAPFQQEWQLLAFGIAGVGLGVLELELVLSRGHSAARSAAARSSTGGQHRSI